MTKRGLLGTAVGVPIVLSVKARRHVHCLVSHCEREHTNEGIFCSAQDSKGLEMFNELQSLSRKDAHTVGFALIRVLENIFAAVRGNGGGEQTLKIVHILVGGAIGTNEAACKILFQWARQQQHISYRLLTVKCASHQCNLIVAVAIMGYLQSRPLDDSPICAAASRWSLAGKPDCLGTLLLLSRGVASFLFFPPVGAPGLCYRL